MAGLKADQVDPEYIDETRSICRILVPVTPQVASKISLASLCMDRGWRTRWCGGENGPCGWPFGQPEWKNSKQQGRPLRVHVGIFDQRQNGP
jgi:hypothetical protein